MIPRISAAVLAVIAAVSFLAPASQPNPVEAARLNNLGCAYMNQQLFEKGLKFFQQAAEADPKLAIARLNEGVAYLNLQKIDEAKAELNDALKLDPKNPNAWYNLGLLAKNTGDSQNAIDAFKRVTELDANDADTWYFLGTAYAQAKQFPQAIESFQHALQINPRHASAEFGLSRAYQQSADVDRANLDHAREHLKKFQYITQNKLGAPMSLAYGEQGQYSRAVESPQAQLKPPPQIKVRFVDVTKESGLISQSSPSPGKDVSAYLSAGACFLDYDNDGKIDIFLPDNGAQGGLSLYHNLGNGKFEDVTKQAGLDGSLHGTACTAADYDNDGGVDLAVSADKGVLLLHNERNGTFKNTTEPAGITSGGTATGLTFIDYDHDGDLDLYVVAGSRSAMPLGEHRGVTDIEVHAIPFNAMWRNNGNGTFTNVTEATGLAAVGYNEAAIGTDYNNDRAVDLVLTGTRPLVYENPREGQFSQREFWREHSAIGVAVLDFDHDGWMDLAFTSMSAPALTLWRNNHGKSFEQVKLPETNWVRAYGVAAFDYDNDGWVDLVAVGETKDGKGEIKLFRNLGPDGFKDVTADVGLDKIHLESPRAIITGDYDNDGAVDLLITQNHGPAVLLKNEGGNQNHWLRLALKGLADNKSAIGTKVEVFSGGNRQKFEIYGSNGYLGQNSPYLTVGLGDAKEADIVRMLWPTGVLQDEINVAGDKQQNFLEIDRRGSSCPTLFVWNGERYEFVADMLGAGVVGHWIGPNQRDIPRPVEWIKIDRSMIREKDVSLGQTACHPERSEGPMHFASSCTDPSPQRAAAQDDKSVRGAVQPSNRARPALSFRFMEPLEEAVYLDQVRLLAVDHPADLDVYPNEYFASNPPYPDFKVVVSRDARPPAAAWDDHGHNVLPDLLAHRYFGDFALTHFLGFAKPHTLTLDLGEPYGGGPLWLLLHGEVEYFSANSMYAASQAGIQAIAPYVEAEDASGNWKRVVDDMGFPAGGPRTMTADLTEKLPPGTRKIRITTNLQIYWDSILIDRTEQVAPASRRGSGSLARRAESGASDYRLTSVPLIRADLQPHGYPLKIEGTPPGNVNYIYEKVSATGPYTRPAGTYTRYGDVLPLLTATDDKLAVFGSGDEVRLDFDPTNLPTLPQGWIRDYFFAANGYEKDMDFYAADGNFVAPLPFLSMGEYPYTPKKSFPLDDEHLNYLLEYNTRHMSGNEQRGYWFDYGPSSRSHE
ncbi:MAG TPA: FG-GAP-like repeat-containing protein [Terriglobales bacterium]|nr:FG-GAP-like repeat-containing protein [Terriglobales bacterium]